MYYEKLPEDIKKKWNCADLPINPLYPSVFRPFSWSGIYVFFIALANTAYCCFGIFKYKKLDDILNLPFIITGIIVFAVQYGYYIQKR